MRLDRMVLLKSGKEDGGPVELNGPSHYGRSVLTGSPPIGEAVLGLVLASRIDRQQSQHQSHQHEERDLVIPLCCQWLCVNAKIRGRYMHALAMDRIEQDGEVNGFMALESDYLRVLGGVFEQKR